MNVMTSSSQQSKYVGCFYAWQMLAFIQQSQCRPCRYSYSDVSFIHIAIFFFVGFVLMVFGAIAGWLFWFWFWLFQKSVRSA